MQTAVVCIQDVTRDYAQSFVELTQVRRTESLTVDTASGARIWNIPIDTRVYPTLQIIAGAKSAEAKEDRDPGTIVATVLPGQAAREKQEIKAVRDSPRRKKKIWWDAFEVWT